MEQDKTDDRVSLEGLDPVAVLKALLAVDPDAPPADVDGKPAAGRPIESDVESDSIGDRGKPAAD
jgi:hypothetical protein